MELRARERYGFSSGQAQRIGQLLASSDDAKAPLGDSPPSTSAATDPIVARPPIRTIALDQLRAAPHGLKAALIREHAERKFGMVLHEKTVGMTLYRLSKENLVHRDGHTWFFGPSPTEPRNPGADTPGQEDVFG